MGDKEGEDTEHLEEKHEEIKDVSEWLKKHAETKEVSESPIDINISKAIPIKGPPLEWFNFKTVPNKTKVTNTGHTVTVTSYYPEMVPYITGGPLQGTYVQSQFHFHWGKNDLEGSEHTVDGRHMPGELHLVMYKSNYRSQENAAKKIDGLVFLTYLIELQADKNKPFDPLVKCLEKLFLANSSVKIKPIRLDCLIEPFTEDYFAYWGSVVSEETKYNVLWIISRRTIGLAIEQLDSFRSLTGANGQQLINNSRPLKPDPIKKVVHINPSPSKYSTLLKRNFDKKGKPFCK